MNTARYSLVQSAFYMMEDAVIGYSTYYLVSKGFSSSGVGIIIAVAALVASLLQPVLGDFTDRTEKFSLQQINSGLALVILLSSGLVWLTHGNIGLVTALCFGINITIIFSGVPLVNALCMYYEARGIRINFGVARGIGSGAYAVVAVIIGKLVDTGSFGADFLPVITAILSVLFIITVVTFRFNVGEATVQKAEASVTAYEADGGIAPARGIMEFAHRYPRFILLICGVTLLFVGHNVLNNYMYQLVETMGGGSSQVGLAGSIAAVVEIPTMFAISLLLRKFSSGSMIRLSGIFFTVKFAACFGALALGSMSLFMAAQTLQILGYALFTPAAVYYADRVVAPSDAVKGQTYMNITLTAGCVIGSLAGGFLIDRIGVAPMMAVICLTSLAGTVITAVFADRSR